MPASNWFHLLDWLAHLISPHVGEASADLTPWGFVVFSAIVLLLSHMRWPRA